MHQIFDSIFGAINGWLFKGVDDKYATIAPSKPPTGEAREIPQSLRDSDIPDFGSDQEKMLAMAVKNYPTLELQVRWLKSMHQVRFGTNHGWIGEVNAAVKPDPRYESLGYGHSYVDPKAVIDAERLIEQVQRTRLALPVEASYPKFVPSVTKPDLTLVRS